VHVEGRQKLPQGTCSGLRCVSRHFFGQDVSSCVVEVREEERKFMGVEGGISRSFKDVTMKLPRVETVDSGEETTRLDGSFSQSVPLSLLSVNGLHLQKVCQPFWVELPRKGGGMFRTRVHEREGVLVLNVRERTALQGMNERNGSFCVLLNVDASS